MKRLLVASLAPAILTLAGCNASAPPPPAAVTAPTQNVQTEPTGGSGCASAVGRYASVIESDQKTGNLNQSVYKVIAGEIAQANAACKAGRDGEAVALVRASKARHGYP